MIYYEVRVRYCVLEIAFDHPKKFTMHIEGSFCDIVIRVRVYWCLSHFKYFGAMPIDATIALGCCHCAVTA